MLQTREGVHGNERKKQLTWIGLYRSICHTQEKLAMRVLELPMQLHHESRGFLSSKIDPMKHVTSLEFDQAYNHVRDSFHLYLRTETITHRLVVVPYSLLFLEAQQLGCLVRTHPIR